MTRYNQIDRAETPHSQCTGILGSHGRHWQCTRRAAKKYAGKLCGFCASMRPKACYADAFGKQYHSASCFIGQEICALSVIES